MSLLKCIIMTLIVYLKNRKESCVCKYKNAYYLVCNNLIKFYQIFIIISRPKIETISIYFLQLMWQADMPKCMVGTTKLHYMARSRGVFVPTKYH